MSLLTIERLKKGYSSPDGERTEIIDIPEFVLDAGEQMALRGSSGCGKTTFLNLIAGILQADSGTIRIAGEPMTGRRESARDRLRSETMGYVFQTFNLLQGYTALENVLLGMMFGTGVDTDRARALLDRVGLAERMDYRPKALSVGQQQRVAVARALANNPKLVLADEPTGNLDHQHASGALALIRDICEENGAALLLVSHDPAILDQFEHHLDFNDVNQVLRAEAS